MVAPDRSALIAFVRERHRRAVAAGPFYAADAESYDALLALLEGRWSGTLQDAVQSRDFYDLMQAYRHTPPAQIVAVSEAFEAVKTFLLDLASPPSSVAPQQALVSLFCPSCDTELGFDTVDVERREPIYECRSGCGLKVRIGALYWVDKAPSSVAPVSAGDLVVGGQHGRSESGQVAGSETRSTQADAGVGGAAAVPEVRPKDGGSDGASRPVHDGSHLSMVRGTVAVPCPSCAHLNVKPAYCDRCEGAGIIWPSSVARGADVEAMRSLAKQATNGWACYAKRKIELDDIGRLHREIDAIPASPAPLPDAAPVGWREMASAPKDGTRMLISDARYMGGAKRFTVLSFWLPYMRDGQPMGNWFGVTEATHWMPLPDPPSSSPAAKEPT